jgi:hypothetical protein
MVASASNRNEYQEYLLVVKGGRCIKLTALPPSCADYLKIWDPQPSGPLGACPDLYTDSFTFTVKNLVTRSAWRPGLLHTLYVT